MPLIAPPTSERNFNPNVAAVLLIHGVPGEAVFGHIDIPVGGGGTAEIVTLAVPVWPPEEAVTVNGPPVTLPAANNPDEEIVPPPFTAHVNATEAIALPNWSAAVAVNCCVPFVATVAVAGVTVTFVRLWLTVTATLLLALDPELSISAAWSV
jgi:hypothetical protein